MLRLVLDPGVLVAAAIAPRGVCRRLLQSVLDGRCVLTVCPDLLTEIDEVLARPKFRRYLSSEQASQYVAFVAMVAEARPDPVVHSGLTPDPDDDYLVALACSADADYLVSGDAHLTGLVDPTPPVLTPRALLEALPHS